MGKFKYNLAVIGLGYVGLPLAIEAANNKLKVAGYDINESVVGSLNKSISHVEDISNKVLKDALSKDLLITSQLRTAIILNKKIKTKKWSTMGYYKVGGFLFY